jgi:hypothetical protein
MLGLGLKYRFQFFLNSPDSERQIVKVVMENSEPPTAEWWKNNWFLIYSGRPWTNTIRIPFLSAETIFRENREFIRRAYRLYETYVCRELWNNPHVDDAFREEIEQTFDRMGIFLAKEMNPSERQEFHHSLQEKFDDLARRADTFRRPLKPATALDYFRLTTSMHRRLLWRLCSWQVEIFYWIQMGVEVLKMWVFERWKYRQPRIHPTGPLPANSIGNTYLL